MRRLVTLVLAMVLIAPAYAGASQRAFKEPAFANAPAMPIKGLTGHAKSAPLASTQPRTNPTLQANDKVVFAGDSITVAGFLDRHGLGWALDFQQTLGNTIPGLTILNAGVAGDRTHDLAVRFNNTVLSLKPTVVVIWVGVNDVRTRVYPGWHGRTQSIAYMQAMLAACLSTPTIREIILVSPECIGEKRNGRNQYDAALDMFSAYLSALAALDTTGRVFYCPMRESWAEQEAFENPRELPFGILTSDATHPSERGSAFICDVFLKEFGLSNLRARTAAPPVR